MANVNLFAQGDSGETVYFLLMRESDRYVYDADDDTWKVNKAACTDFKVSATENTDAGDADESTYHATLDGANLNSATVPIAIQVTALYDKATDEIFANAELWAANSNELDVDLAGLLDWLRDVAEGDVEVDTVSNPYNLVISIKDTSTELVRKKLYQVDDAGVSATTHIVGKQLESAP